MQDKIELRKEFENWCQKELGLSNFAQDKSGDYWNNTVSFLWVAWQEQQKKIYILEKHLHRLEELVEYQCSLSDC